MSVTEQIPVSGTEMLFDPVLDLEDLDGSNGFVINGIDERDGSGGSVSSAGDVNGDGLDDLIIGAPGAIFNNPLWADEIYIVFGSNSGFGPSLNLADLNGSNGFVISGTLNRLNTYFDVSVSSAGDVNGDGIDDLVIGIPWSEPIGNHGTGASYVVFGSSSGFDPRLEIADRNGSNLNGNNGFVINGIDPDDRLGESVSSAGDVNGDGLDDLIIGAWGSNFTSESYVIFGSSSGFNPNVEVTDLDGSNGFVINGGGPLVGGGGPLVSGAGDVNGDGLDDLIIGNSVVFGSSSGFAPNVEVTDLNGSNGFVINGIDFFDSAGTTYDSFLSWSVSGAEDVNGDGLDDLIIGISRLIGGQLSVGESYVVFGSSSGFGPSVEVTDLDGSNGFVTNGFLINQNFHNDGSDMSVSSAGDVNGDGLDDLIIGTPEAEPNGQPFAGESYVIFGSSSFAPSLEFADLDGSNGFVIPGLDERDFSGTSVSSAGDVNGDGIDDLIIGAPFADPNGISSAGESYVIFGRSNDLPVEDRVVIGDESDNELVGGQGNDLVAGEPGDADTAGSDYILGGDGDDILRGDRNRRSAQVGEAGGDDFIDGGAGNDRIGGKAGDDTLLGGEGDDQIWGDDGDDILRGGLGNDILTGDDFSGGRGSDLFVLAVGEGTDTLVDFEVGIDLIGLAESLTFGTLSLEAQGNDTLIRIGSETLAIVQNVGVTNFTEASFIAV